MKQTEQILASRFLTGKRTQGNVVPAGINVPRFIFSFTDIFLHKRSWFYTT